MKDTPTKDEVTTTPRSPSDARSSARARGLSSTAQCRNGMSEGVEE